MDYKDRSEYRYEFFTRYEDNGLILLEDEYILDVNRLIYEKQSITLNKVTINKGLDIKRSKSAHKELKLTPRNLNLSYRNQLFYLYSLFV